MAMLVKPLGLTTPIAAFNGGLLVNPDMSVIQQRVLPAELVAPVASLTGSFGLINWIYRGPDSLQGHRPAARAIGTLRHADVLSRMPAGQLAGVMIPYSWILR
jgi:hydroxymethylpyrimidine pyrophosphatase-like HAD family hydrolase